MKFNSQCTLRHSPNLKDDSDVLIPVFPKIKTIACRLYALSSPKHCVSFSFSLFSLFFFFLFSFDFIYIFYFFKNKTTKHINSCSFYWTQIHLYTNAIQRDSQISFRSACRKQNAKKVFNVRTKYQFRIPMEHYDVAYYQLEWKSTNETERKRKRRTSETMCSFVI